MNAHIKILQLIRLASNALSKSVSLYKQLKDIDEQKLLKLTGSSLAYLFEIDDILCSATPELISDEWRLINQDKDAFEHEMEWLDEALKAEADEDLKLAKLMFSQIEQTSMIENNRICAQAGLYRMYRNENNLGFAADHFQKPLQTGD